MADGDVDGDGDADADGDADGDAPGAAGADESTGSEPGTGRPGALVVPVEETSTLRATVAHAVEIAAAGEFREIHFVGIASWRTDDPGAGEHVVAAEHTLERVGAWANADLDDVDVGGDDVPVTTAILGGDEYLFGPDDYVRMLTAYAESVDADTVLLDPEYTPVGNTTLLQPLEFALSNTSLAVETAPVTRPTRRERLRTEATGVRFAAMFGVSLAFYLVLGDPTYWFDWATGIATAAIVSITFSRISFDSDPTIPRTPMRLLRGMAYVPVLLFEILKANLVVARVILDPRLPIDPTMNRVRVIVGRGLPLMTLANSITLTPGTLTVRARDNDLYVQSLLPSARDGLFDGSLERWTRFIYYGRDAARLPTPRERDDVEILQGPNATEGLPIAQADGGAVNEIDADEDPSEANEMTGRSGSGASSDGDDERVSAEGDE